MIWLRKISPNLSKVQQKIASVGGPKDRIKDIHDQITVLEVSDIFHGPTPTTNVQL